MVDMKGLNHLIQVRTQPASVPVRKRDPKEITPELRKFYPASRARLNFIPSQEALQELIDKALTALSRGIFWDRGSIINILL